jgi:hypothetical protein
MKRIYCIMLLVLGLVTLVWGPTPGRATTESTTITGAATAAYGSGAALGSVAVKSLELGTGVFIEPDGTATGVFSAVLTGKALLGQSRQITINGKVLSGEVAPDGRVYFNGIASVDLGDGTPSLAGVPFSVSTTGNNVSLSIDTTTLPPAQLEGGGISIN